MAEEKKSPWLSKQEVQPADLPREVYEQTYKDDDTKLERDIVNASLLGYRVPPGEQWKTCWACGAKVPMRFRDSMYGILVCHSCLVKSAQHTFFEAVEELLGSVDSYLGLLTGQMESDDDDDGSEDDGEYADEPEDTPLDEVDAPEIAQGNTPRKVEEAKDTESEDEETGPESEQTEDEE